jgi:hypothetical protein
MSLIGSLVHVLDWFFDPDSWLDELKGFKSIGFSAVGTTEQLKEFSAKTNRKWTLGIKLKPALE